MEPIHRGASRVSTPVQHQQPPPVSPIEQLVAPRRSRTLNKRHLKKQKNAHARLHGGTNPSNINFQMPGLSPLRHGNTSSVLYSSTDSTLDLSRSTVVNIDRAQKLKSGSTIHRARILTVGPQDITYAGQAFNEAAVTDVGNFSLSDVIGRNYTPSSAGLTLRVVRSMAQGAQSTKDAQELKYLPPPLPLGNESSTTTTPAINTVLTDNERKQSERSLTYERNPKTGEKIIHAMAQKIKKNQLKVHKKFNPHEWNPRGRAPEVVLTTENRLKQEMSRFSVVLKQKTGKDVRSEDSVEGSDSGSTSNTSEQQFSRNGKWSLTDDRSYFEPTASYNDTMVSIINQVGSGASTLGDIAMANEQGADSFRYTGAPVLDLVKDRLAVIDYNETRAQKESDFTLRQQLVDHALERMFIAPTQEREHKVLLSNLQELSYEHRLASTKATLAYEGLLVDESSGSITTPPPPVQITSTQSLQWEKEHDRLNQIRVTIENTLCTCEPLQRDLQKLWNVQSQKLRLNVVDDPSFQDDMPMPLSDFSSLFINSVVETRKTLLEEWLPATLKICLSHLVAFLREVMVANKKEHERIELARSMEITNNAR